MSASNQDCIFCRILAGEIPATVLYRDDEVAAIADLAPQAPEHILVMPVMHAENLESFVASAPAHVVSKLFEVASRIGKERGPSGFRAVINTGREGGQTVPHLHVHVLAGRPMSWPPG
ncbi:MAG TPA: HIT domain-containing protein [Candidatus Baltobacteraceae bacterium]|jgi:histidine triad (HIT) family protein|nr:HIT domain-containing protein [Candidatus Baltobacteraceae bacterium]